jgi:hypothetical protein
MNETPESTKSQTQVDLEKRIEELGAKSSQLLLFLSFAITAAAVLRSSQTPIGACQQAALTHAMRWWTGAVFPILIGILPVKEINWGSPLWYQIVRWLKFVFLWVAIVFIVFGAMQFYYAL